MLLRFALFSCIFALALPSDAQTFNEALGTGALTNVTTGDYNVAIGDSALTNLTSDSGTIAIGFKAGCSIDTNTSNPACSEYLSGGFTSPGNVFIGIFAGLRTTTGQDNVFIGELAGSNVTSATDNTFVGAKAGLRNTSGVDNTFIGEEAGAAVTTGRDNTMIGEGAGSHVSTGDDNTFVGSASGGDACCGNETSYTGYKNTGIGNDALQDIQDGYRNTALGDSAGLDIGNGNFNTMLGQAAGWATEHADYNTMVGWSAGGDNNRTNNTNDANRNTYLGARTGYSNREGQDNVGIGAFADFSLNGSTGGSQHWEQTTFVGADADVNHDYVSMLGFSTRADAQYATVVGWNGDARGTRSTGLGASVVIGAGSDDAVAIGEAATIGSNADQSIAIGPDATIAENATNSIALGNGASVAASNEAYVGNAATTSIGGIVNWTATSDARLKTDVTGDVPGLDFVRQLRPVRYRFDLAGLQAMAGERSELADALLAKSQDWQTGFLAQDVAAAADALGFEFSGVVRPSEGRTHFGLRYAEFVAPLTRAVQELDARVIELESKIEEQQAMLARYEAVVARLTAKEAASGVVTASIDD